MWELLLAPFKNPSLLWQLIPLWGLWIALEFYFGYYKQEKLGWNTALGNGISLFWIVIGTIQYMSQKGLSNMSVSGIIFMSIVTIYALFIVMGSFKHWISKKVMFFFAAPPIIYYSSILVILFAYEAISFSGPMLIAILLLFTFFLFLKVVLQHIMPDKTKPEDAVDDDSFLSSKQSSSQSSSFDTSDYDLRGSSDPFSSPSSMSNQSSSGFSSPSSPSFPSSSQTNNSFDDLKF